MPRDADIIQSENDTALQRKCPKMHKPFNSTGKAEERELSYTHLSQRFDILGKAKLNKDK